MTAICLDCISKTFADTAVLENISLDIASGEFIVLVGPSSCGKSTLLRILAGLETPSGGRIIMDGADITATAPGKRNIALIFQNYALFPHMTVEKNILFGLKIRGEPKAQFAERLAAAAELLQLTPYLKRKPKELSGGQRQRVAMARAIIRNPALFLMDEPLSNLDAKLRIDVRQGITALHERLQTTTVYVTHDQTEAITMADRIAVLNRGRLQQVGTPQTLYHHPCNTFVASFIGSPAMNLIDCANDAPLLQPLTLPANHTEDSIILGIRPEHISLTPIADAASCSAVILRAEMHGADWQLAASSGLGELRLRITDTDIPAPNTAVTLYFPKDKLHYFSPSTQRNLKGTPL